MIKAAQFDNFFDFFHEFRSQVRAGKKFDVMGTPSWYWPRSMFLPWPRCDLKEVPEVTYVPDHNLDVTPEAMYELWSSMGVITLMADWQYLYLRDGTDNYYIDYTQYPLKLNGRYGNSNLPTEPQAPVVPVTGMTLTPARMDFTVGFPDEFKTTAIKMTPASATDKSYTIVRSDADNEKFTLVDNGEGRLTVSQVTEAGTYKVTVTPVSNPEVTKQLTINAVNEIPLESMVPNTGMLRIPAGDHTPREVKISFTPEDTSDKRYTTTTDGGTEGNLDVNDNGAGVITITATSDKPAIYGVTCTSVRDGTKSCTFAVQIEAPAS